MAFKDHFSGHAADYARFRPGYPDELFDYLARLAPERRLAWDCACGNGQASRQLVAHFESVVATDASSQQIESATPVGGVEFRVAQAQCSGLADASADLITVAQALHWFDVAAFYGEARRVLVSSGILAAWCYRLCRVDDRIDALIDRLYDDVLASYWPPERRHIEAAYTTLQFPRPRLDTPAFEMTIDWTVDDMLGYLVTWSAVQRFRNHQDTDPLNSVADDLVSLWGGGCRTVRWPLTLLVWRAPR